MEKYNNPLAPSKDLVPSGRNSLDGALKNGTRALNSPDSESRIVETSHDVEPESNNGQDIQDMQNQIEQLQRSVTLIFWYQVRIALDSVPYITLTISVGPYGSDSPATYNPYLSIIPAVAVFLAHSGSWSFSDFLSGHL